MPIMLNLTSADHGGTRPACGTGSCGPNCSCGCPYSAMLEKGHVELIATIEARHPGEWLGLVIPPGEDEYAPEQAMLVVHSPDDDEVWDAVQHITSNQVVHVYFNGSAEQYWEMMGDEAGGSECPPHTH